MSLLHTPSLSSTYRPDPLVSCFFREFINEYWRGNRAPSPQEEDSLLKDGVPDFISRFDTKVPSNLPRSIFDIPLCSYERVM